MEEIEKTYCSEERAWAAIEATNIQLKETDRQLKATNIQLESLGNRVDHYIASHEKMIRELKKEVGGISNSNGEIAEEYFENIFYNDRTFAGMHFHEIIKRRRFDDRKRNDEFDIIMLNDENAVIVETKYKAHENDIEAVIKKAEAFRYWYPEHKEHKIYLCLASLRFEDNIVGKARKKGIAILQQLGDKTVVNEENLKAY